MEQNVQQSKPARTSFWNFKSIKIYISRGEKVLDFLVGLFLPILCFFIFFILDSMLKLLMVFIAILKVPQPFLYIFSPLFYLSWILGFLSMPLLLVYFSKRRKFIFRGLIIGIALFILIFVLLIYVALSSLHHKGADARRMSDLRTIGLAMEDCYKDPQCGAGENTYLTSSLKPMKIGALLEKFPSDIEPEVSLFSRWLGKVRNPELYHYHWVDNIGNDQKFCVWTKLEEGKYYFVVTHLGVAEVESKIFEDLPSSPPTLADCERAFN